MAVMVGCRVVLSDGAGQGAHREVGSEGFAANHRAVAEPGEPVGQNSGENRAGTMAAKEILGAPGCIKVCAGGTVGQEHALPREVSYGLIPTGMGTWAYKPEGEVAGDAVRGVGVTRGTQEPGATETLGSPPARGGGPTTQKVSVRGKGSRREMAN